MPTLFELDLAEAARVISARDEPMARLVARTTERLGPPRITRSTHASPYHALGRSILHQQITGAAAQTILGRLSAAHGRDGAFPDPPALLAASDEALRACGLSRPKVAALRDLAGRAADGTIPSFAELERLDDEAIVERLVVVRGIGRWTVQMMLLFTLGRTDVLPVADFGVRKGYQRIYRRKEMPTEAELTKRAEKWRPYRSLASWYLWRATEE